MTSFVLNPLGRKPAWQALFIVGVGSFVVAALEFWWNLAPAVYQAPPVVAAAPAPVRPAVPAAFSLAQAKIIQSLPPAKLFTTPSTAPVSLPELGGLERPQPSRKLPAEPFVIQHTDTDPPAPLHLREP